MPGNLSGNTIEKWWVSSGFDNLEFKDFRRQRISSQVVVIGPCGDLLGAYYDLKDVV